MIVSTLQQVQGSALVKGDVILGGSGNSFWIVTASGQCTNLKTGDAESYYTNETLYVKCFPKLVLD